MQKLCPLFGSSFRSTKNTHKISDVVGETKLLILVRLSVLSLSLPPLSLSLARSLVLPLSSRLYFSFSHVATAQQPLHRWRNRARRYILFGIKRGANAPGPEKFYGRPFDRLRHARARIHARVRVLDDLKVENESRF